mmetsp:Transcript_4483/g.12571  ORF Transcript_4483/g.12571 Transcript_4483/m.12571 type:complete len:226 (-) Transcript_4483:439-1116(-)
MTRCCSIICRCMACCRCMASDRDWRCPAGTDEGGAGAPAGALACGAAELVPALLKLPDSAWRVRSILGGSAETGAGGGSICDSFSWSCVRFCRCRSTLDSVRPGAPEYFMSASTSAAESSDTCRPRETRVCTADSKSRCTSIVHMKEVDLRIVSDVVAVATRRMGPPLPARRARVFGDVGLPAILCIEWGADTTLRSASGESSPGARAERRCPKLKEVASDPLGP